MKNLQKYKYLALCLSVITGVLSLVFIGYIVAVEAVTIKTKMLIWVNFLINVLAFVFLYWHIDDKD